jgi:hypothetical protein
MIKRRENVPAWLLAAAILCFIVPTDLTAAERFPKRTVDNFFRTWLVQKDEDATIKFFHRRVFLNRYMLDGCPDEYLKDEERGNPSKVEGAVRKVIREALIPKKVVLTLPSDDPLNVFGDFIASLKKSSINVPDRDKYLIVEYRTFMLKAKDSPTEGLFRKHYDLRGAFVCYAAIRSLEGDDYDGLLYFLWVRDGRIWKIAHMGFVCQ